VQPSSEVADDQEHIVLAPSPIVLEYIEFPRYKHETQAKLLRHLSEQGGAAGLNSLNLQDTERCAPEACWKLVAVECHARGRLN
jgi:hypothetical protein